MSFRSFPTPTVRPLKVGVYASSLSVLVLALGAGAMAQPKVLLTANGIGGIEILGNENVPSETARNLRQRAADGVLPYIVIVRNTGPLPVTGLDIRYEITTKGDTVVHDFFYGSPTDLADPASPSVIAPGKTATFSPSHKVNQQVNWDGLSLSDRDVVDISRTADLYREADQIRISVDSVIRSDGTIVGPDLSGTYRMFQQEMWGYREFRNELLKKFSEGESDDNIMSWLTQTANTAVTKSGRNQRSDHSVITQKMLAQEYLALMESGQRQEGWDRLKAAPSEVALRRIAKVHPEVKP